MLGKLCRGLFKLTLLTACLQAGAAVKVNQEEVIEAQIHRNFPFLRIDDISPSPIIGLYQVVSGSMVLYASEDGRYLIYGDVLDMSQTQKNITEHTRKDRRRRMIDLMGTSSMIIYPAEGDKLGEVVIFTDTGCIHSQRLHQEVPKLNAMGIEVQYLSFVAAHHGAQSYETMLHVWSAQDRRQALDAAMQQRPFDVAEKDHPEILKMHYDLGHELTVKGTPAILFKNGDLLIGYQSAQKIADRALSALSAPILENSNNIEESKE